MLLYITYSSPNILNYLLADVKLSINKEQKVDIPILITYYLLLITYFKSENWPNPWLKAALNWDKLWPPESLLGKVGFLFLVVWAIFESPQYRLKIIIRRDLPAQLPSKLGVIVKYSRRFTSKRSGNDSLNLKSTLKY